MRMSIRVLAATLVFCAAAHSPSNGAQADLDAKELRELIVGNTVHGENLRRMPFKQFFDSNGTFFTEFAGMVLTGTWTIGSNGTLCLTNLANPANPCAVIRKNADGTDERIAAGV